MPFESEAGRATPPEPGLRMPTGVEPVPIDPSSLDIFMNGVLPCLIVAAAAVSGVAAAAPRYRRARIVAGGSIALEPPGNRGHLTILGAHSRKGRWRLAYFHQKHFC